MQQGNKIARWLKIEPIFVSVLWQITLREGILCIPEPHWGGVWLILVYTLSAVYQCFWGGHFLSCRTLHWITRAYWGQLDPCRQFHNSKHWRGVSGDLHVYYACLHGCSLCCVHSFSYSVHSCVLKLLSGSCFLKTQLLSTDQFSVKSGLWKRWKCNIRMELGYWQ